MMNILAHQGYDCLDVPYDGNGNEIGADAQNPAHADYAALPAGQTGLIDARIKFLDGNRVVLPFTPSLKIFRLGQLLKQNVEIQIKMYPDNPNVWSIRYHGAEALRLTANDINVRFYVQQVCVQPLGVQRFGQCHEPWEKSVLVWGNWPVLISEHEHGTCSVMFCQSHLPDLTAGGKWL